MSSGVLLPSICMRCLLHEAILQTGALRTAPKHIARRCEAFSTHRPRLQEARRSTAWDQNKGGYKWRSIALFDEKQDGKQKQKPLIILEDEPKGKDKARVNPRRSELSIVKGKIGQEDATGSPSAEHIRIVASEKRTVPKQEDVNTSIEAMRLEATKKSTVVDLTTFQVLLHGLEGYTVHQLGRYLERSIQSPSKKVYELHTTPWRAGRTPLEQRIPKDVRKKRPSTKLKVAEQILRLVWEITVESEENVDGELEIRLEPWQISLLFDIPSNGMRYLDGIVTPQTLMQNSQIQDYRPDNIIRITGRCQTAEEIARQLRTALLRVHRLDWDLKPLASSSGSLDDVPRAVFRNEDIRYVAQLTETVIIPQNEGTVAIYCMNRDGMLNARRLLLALMDQPHLSNNVTAITVDESTSATSRMLVGNSEVGLHRRYHGLDLVRVVEPLTVRSDSNGEVFGVAEANVEKLAVTLAKQLNQVELSHRTGSLGERSNSYWREHAPSNPSGWKTKFCTLLHPADQGETLVSNLEGSRRSPSIVQHAVPGLESLLSCFETPRDPKASQSAYSGPAWKPNPTAKVLPYIKAHLKPLPRDSNSAVILPRLEMRFHFSHSTPKSEKGTRELLLTGMQAIVADQRFSVPLPGYATDLQFTRQSKLMSKIDSVRADPDIMRFVRHLQKSARENEGALTAPAELNIKLPSWLVEPKQPADEAGRKDITVKYMFERFEQIQKMAFSPRQVIKQDQELDADVIATLESLPESLYLDYREVEGGAIYGNSTTLALGFKRDRGRPGTGVDQQPEEPLSTSFGISSLDLTGATLRIAHLLTCANSGTLKRVGGKTKM